MRKTFSLLAFMLLLCTSAWAAITTAHTVVPNLGGTQYEIYSFGTIFTNKAVKSDYSTWIEGGLTSNVNTSSSTALQNQTEWFNTNGSLGYGYGQITSKTPTTVTFRVTNCIEVAVMSKSGGSNRGVTLSVKENGSSEELGTQCTSQVNSATALVYGTALEGSKTYNVTVSSAHTAGDGGNITIYQIRFKSPAAFSASLSGTTSNASATTGTSAGTINCGVTNGEAASATSYQWYKTTSNKAAASAIDGATSSSYSPNETEDDTYYYYCAVTPKNQYTAASATYTTKAESALSGAFVFSSGSCDAVPSAPTAFTSTSVTAHSVSLSITDVADAKSYDIYYSTSNTAPNGETAATTNVKTKTPTIEGLAASTTYYAWVRSACDASYKSGWVALTGSTFTTSALSHIYYYKDATHYDGVSYKNPEGNTPSGSNNVPLTSPWSICNGCVAGITSVIATGAIYDNKGTHMNSYIKLRTNESGKIVFTIASGYKATIKIKMGGFSSNPSITMKLNDSGNSIDFTGTMSGGAEEEDGYAELTYADLAAGAYTLKPTSGSLYISQIDIQTTQVITITAAQYATYYNEKAYVMPTGLEGYVVTAANTTSGALTLVKAYEEGDVVAAYEPLVLHSTSATTFTLDNTSSSGTNYSGNLLSGARDGNGKTIGGVLYYRLSYTDGTNYSDIGFYWGAANGAAFEIAEGKAYLPLSAGQNAPSRFLFTDQENNATNIENIEASDKAIKFIENGQLYIKRDGVVYDALGRIVR